MQKKKQRIADGFVSSDEVKNDSVDLEDEDE